MTHGDVDGNAAGKNHQQSKRKEQTMKLNFLNVLKKESTPDEIAEQIVALEVKKSQCENSRDGAKNVCKELRGKTMCGESVNAEAVKQADKAYEESVLDLEIVEESLEELKKNLYTALEAHHAQESKQINIDRQKFASEKEKFLREVSKVKGRLVGLMIGVYHYESEVVHQLGNIGAFSISNTDPNYAEFTAEKNRALSELKRPTPADLEDAIQRKDIWISSFKIDDEYESILKKYRAKITERQPVAV
jgi:hypothetical protein